MSGDLATNVAVQARPQTPQVNFNQQVFRDGVVRGPRFVWERRIDCPCASVNTQTRQADPACPVCNGSSFFRVGPRSYTYDVDAPADGPPLTDTQAAVQARFGGALIRGLITSALSKEAHFDSLGSWYRGEALLTVLHENRPAHDDRLICIDGEIDFNEVVVADGTAALATKYPVVSSVELLSITAAGTLQRYIQDVHYRIDAGVVTFYPTEIPAAETRLSLRYVTFPPWIVDDFPHTTRLTTETAEDGARTPQRSTVKSIVRLEWLESAGPGGPDA